MNHQTSSQPPTISKAGKNSFVIMRHQNQWKIPPLSVFVLPGPHHPLLLDNLTNQSLVQAPPQSLLQYFACSTSGLNSLGNYSDPVQLEALDLDVIKPWLCITLYLLHSSARIAVSWRWLSSSGPLSCQDPALELSQSSRRHQVHANLAARQTLHPFSV